MDSGLEVSLVFSVPREKSYKNALEILRELISSDYGYDREDINFNVLESDNLFLIFPSYQGRELRYDKMFYLRYSFLDTEFFYSSYFVTRNLNALLYFSEFSVGNLAMVKTLNDFLILSDQDLEIEDFTVDNRKIRAVYFSSSYEYALAFEIIEYYGGKVYNHLVDRSFDSTLMKKNIIFTDLDPTIDLKKEIAYVRTRRALPELGPESDLPWFIKYELLLMGGGPIPKPRKTSMNKEQILKFLETNCFNTEDFISKEEFSSFSIEELQNVFGLSKNNDILIPIYPEDETSEPFYYSISHSRKKRDKLFCYDIVSFGTYDKISRDPIQRKKIPYESKLLLRYFHLIKSGILFYPERINFLDRIQLEIEEEDDRVYNTRLYYDNEDLAIEGPDFLFDQAQTKEDIMENFIQNGYYFSPYFYQFYQKTGKFSRQESFIFSILS